MAAHPAYEVTSHQQAQAWRAWADQASDEELLQALRGCATWLSVPADVCSDLLAAHGFILVGAKPAEVTLDRYEPLAGDIYVLEVRTGRFTVHRYDGQSWEQTAALSEPEVHQLTAPMEFVYESRDKRRYYRPALEEKE
jgi:hypothetical protein